MRGLALVIRYLTIVPWPGVPWPGVPWPGASGRSGSDRALEALGRAAMWFPIVGLGIGLILVAADRATARVFPPVLAGLLTVGVWKVLTGGLHLDGLADCLDGLAGRDPEHRLAIMRDSRIGVFGATGLILVLLLDVAAVVEITPGQRWRVLIAAPAIGRVAPLVVAVLFPPARLGGQGAHFRGGLRRASVPLALGIAALVATAVLGTSGLAALGVAVLGVILFARALARRLNGITGDVLGASVELAELAVLLTVAAWLFLRH